MTDVMDRTRLLTRRLRVSAILIAEMKLLQRARPA
jgi:hypothetical protein